MSKWNIKANNVEDVVNHLLGLRGIVEPEEREKFLSPDWDRDIYSPFLFKKIKAASRRLIDALKNGEKITIHGDYDADGVCGATLIYSALQEILEYLQPDIFPEIIVFLPDREKDGYGVAMHNIDRFIEDGVNLLITVDCGISNIDELLKAHEGNIDVIICDHHQLAATQPEHALIIHPLASGEDYPNKHLCGTGVAFKLICAVMQTLREDGVDLPLGLEKWYLDLVAIATVTDVMPILGENRVLEHFGLLVLSKTRRPGLAKIISQAQITKMDTESIGFRIGPRINAAGRIGKAFTAFEALTAKSTEIAEEKMYELEKLNRQRQQISSSAYSEARQMAAENPDAPIHIVYSQDWHPGIVGLIAGKLTTEFGVPAFALTAVNNAFVGSGRSAGGLHLVEAMKACGDIYIKAGGHPEACGLTLANIEMIQIFKERMTSFADNFFKDRDQSLSLEIDLELSLDRINLNLIEQINKLQPFGQGNKAPLFASKKAKLHDIRTVGKKNEHLKLQLLGDSGQKIDGIGFSLGNLYDDIIAANYIDLAYELGVNDWMGKRTPQLLIRDIKF
jgi:single-stranded-DNA-specific exonuclease